MANKKYKYILQYFAVFNKRSAEEVLKKKT